jgi:hypothetical protein
MDGTPALFGRNGLRFGIESLIASYTGFGRGGRLPGFAAYLNRLPQMFFAKVASQAVAKLCGDHFGLFQAPGAFALSDAGNGEHCFSPFSK